MTLAEVQKEVASWDAGAQRKLMAFLSALAFQQEGVDAAELSRRAKDQDPDKWVTLEEARKRLSTQR
ncbi:MAG TPA: hypothetical protein DCY13_19905 [Verrucomicrobiales bacterium]|nr:hypothetical protein [Verrucomicrobiales bacterium]